MIGGTWPLTAPDRSWSIAVPRLAATMVVLPVFLQAPWVRLHPFSAALFTGLLLAVGILLNQTGRQNQAEIGQLLVGFSGSWLAGCLFWGWLRAHPILHLPIEAFALPLALGGLNGRWRLASAFYLSSLIGTACTDLMMALTGVMKDWPAVVSAPFDQAPGLLHDAGLQLLNPAPLLALGLAAALILMVGRRLSQAGETWCMAGAVLVTTVWVDGLFLLTALLQPGFSGLIE
ncbi:MAG: DUF3120 domain-containing protein [Synechococcus sp.]|nr:DUF3120 domain-containing protein [Synechococcus sp.]